MMNCDDTESSKVEQCAYAVIGAAIEVHRHLSPGFLESAYEAALAIELKERAVRFERQVVLPVVYKDHIVGDHRLDLLVEGCLVVELKTVDLLQPIHVSQAIAYLKAANLRLALLINFNTANLRSGIRRVIRDEH